MKFWWMIALCALPTTVLADDLNVTFTDCVTMQSDPERLACYDKQMARIIKAKKLAGAPVPTGLAAPILWDPDAPPPPPPATATAPTATPAIPDEKYCASLRTVRERVECTGRIPASSQPENYASKTSEFKQVDALDVLATPEKWARRNLKVRRAHVYWVDDGDIRFVLKPDVTLFVKSVNGPDWRHFKENCETAREALSDKCLADVLFSYDRHDTDRPNGYEKRLVLGADAATAIRATRKR